MYLILPWIAAMFAGGVIFAYLVLLPPAIKFLFSFGADIATPQIRIGNYITVAARFLLAIGLVFELPVVTTFLARSLGHQSDVLAKTSLNLDKTP